MSTALAVVVEEGGARLPERPAVVEDQDRFLVARWLHGRCKGTRDNYERDVTKFMRCVNTPLAHVTIDHLHAFADLLEIEGLSKGTRRRVLSTIKSLLTYAQKTGYLRFNVGAALDRSKMPKASRPKRYLTEAETMRLIELETNRRNYVLLRLFYVSGIRVSELTGLRCGDCAERDKGQGQITVLGKGEKVRSVLLSAETWRLVQELRDGREPEDALFRSRKGQRALTRTQVLRIVKAAGVRAGLENISPHWLRHAHISHALDRGAPVHLVQQTVGHASLSTTSLYAHARPDDSSSLYLGL